MVISAHHGWEFRITDLSAAELEAAPKFVEWEPTYISKPEFIVLNILCNGAVVRLDNSSLGKSLKADNVTPDELAASLASKNLTYVHQGELRLLTQECICAVVPGDSGPECTAGENRTGRLQRWISRRMARRQASAKT